MKLFSSQGDCSVESELMKEDVNDGRTTKPNADKIPRKKRPKSSSDHCWDEAPEDQRENDTLIQSDRIVPDERVDGVRPESDPPSQHACLECLLDPSVQQDEGSDLQHMFYQPEQSVGPKRCRHNLTTRAFQMILDDVNELLSRSPPQGCEFSLPDLSVPAEEPLSAAYQVTFSLAPVNGDALSPGWDELFDDEDFTKAEEQPSPDESVDLFGDDEAFLQLSVPDVQTPDKSTGPDGKQLQTPVDGSDQPFNCSQDFFSVNFDLGFESEEEESLKASPAVSSTRPRPLEGIGWSPAARPSASTPNHVFLPPAGRRASARGSFQKTLSQRSLMLQQRLSCAGDCVL